MTLGRDADPHDITQDLLDRSGEALISGNFEMMKSCFILPQGFSTFDGKRMVETEDQLRDVFNNVRDEYARQGVTKLIRTIVAATRKSDTQIEATHISHMFAGNLRISKPFPVFAVTRWTGTDWRVASSDYAVEPGTNHSRVLCGAVSQDNTTQLQTGERQ